MLITHQIQAEGHYITIAQNNITLTVRTDNGRASELAAEAVEMRQKANRLIRNADLIRDAIWSGELPD